jgi:hypothetical protein
MKTPLPSRILALPAIAGLVIASAPLASHGQTVVYDFNGNSAPTVTDPTSVFSDVSNINYDGDASRSSVSNQAFVRDQDLKTDFSPPRNGFRFRIKPTTSFSVDTISFDYGGTNSDSINDLDLEFRLEINTQAGGNEVLDTVSYTVAAGDTSRTNLQTLTFDASSIASLQNVTDTVDGVLFKLWAAAPNGPVPGGTGNGDLALWDNVTVTVPEPSAMPLAAGSLCLALVALRRRSRR